MTTQCLSMEKTDKTSRIRGNEQLIIQGISVDNKRFRPSDWVERISASMAVFGSDNKLRYSNYVQPCVIDDLKCLLVAEDLSEMDPAAYDFIMGFAQTNNLRICEDRRYAPESVDDDQRKKRWTYPLRANAAAKSDSRD